MYRKVTEVHKALIFLNILFVLAMLKLPVKNILFYKQQLEMFFRSLKYHDTSYLIFKTDQFYSFLV